MLNPKAHRSRGGLFSFIEWTGKTKLPACKNCNSTNALKSVQFSTAKNLKYHENS